MSNTAQCPILWIEGMVPQVDVTRENTSSSLVFRRREGIFFI